MGAWVEDRLSNVPRQTVTLTVIFISVILSIALILGMFYILDAIPSSVTKSILIWVRGNVYRVVV